MERYLSMRNLIFAFIIMQGFYMVLGAGEVYSQQVNVNKGVDFTNYLILADELLYINTLSLGISQDFTKPIWCNGEYEQGPRSRINLAKNGYLASIGHVSLGGVMNGNVYCPSLDTFGPDGRGRVTRTGNGQPGILYGNLGLMDGWYRNPEYPRIYDSVEYLRRTVEDGYPVYGGNYGFYDSVAGNRAGVFPGANRSSVEPQDNVVVHDVAKILDNPNTPVREGKINVFYNHGSGDMIYDPNMDEKIALLEPGNGGTVLLTKDLPKFDWLMAYEKALIDGTHFNTWKDFKNYITQDKHAVFIGNSLYYEIFLDEDYDEVYEEAIWYIGDCPDNDGDGVVEWKEIHDLEKDVPWELLGAGVIIHGAIVCEGDFITPVDNGFHVYGSGYYDVTVGPGNNKTGKNSFYMYGNDYLSNQIPVLENGVPIYMFDDNFKFQFKQLIPGKMNKNYKIPYQLPAVVAGGNIYLRRTGPIPSGWEEKNNLPKLIADSPGVTSYSFIHGSIAAGEKIIINAANLSGSIFLKGNLLARVIQLEGWTYLDYDSSIQETKDWWIW